MQFDISPNPSHYRGGNRDAEMKEILGMAMKSGMFNVSRRAAKILVRAESVRKLRGMVNKNESPWVTFRHQLAAGTVRLIRRRGKPPLLVTK